MAFTTNQRIIEGRRRQDEKYRQMDSAIAEDRRILHVANFELTTSNKIANRMKQERYLELKGQQDEILNQRRHDLADLYNTELNNWKEEILSKVETPEDRKQRIMERAYALKDARENERKEFVKQRYDQQWRDANDDARTLDSKAMLKYMSRERLAQIEEKQRRREQLSADEDVAFAEWNRQLEAMAERDRLKKEAIRNADRKTKEDLKQQIDYNTKKKQEHYLRTMAEDAEEINEINAALQDEEEIQRMRREEERKRGREILEFNEDYKRFMIEEKKVQIEHDALLLEYALRKEREAISAEETKKKASHEAAARFRAYLEEQMKKEAIDTAFVDEVRRREEEKVWKARDDALKARDDARKYLMKTVDEGRQEQLRLKQIDLIKEKEEGRMFANKFLEEARIGVEKEKQEAERRKQIALENSVRLKDQINQRYEQSEALKQEAYLEDKHMQYIEKHHRQRLSEQAGNLRLNYPLKQSQWYT